MHIQNIHKIYINHAEKIKWLCIFLIILSIIVNYYFFVYKFLKITKIIYFSTLLILIVSIFINTNIGQHTLKFIHSIKIELSHIIWPNYKETLKITGIILLLTILTSIFLWLLDGIILRIISWVLTPRL
ncbi:preprotein translocase IISP family, membrane subunit [Buchnera aphidicola BCc]|uniref:Protein translocase subunit SecE n=2 Tax=Buchnera aphidicola TaxID=9 RepID=Q058D9_BUCCC|nr:preprotein translocase IISP family, membrane subunit [Buchnera aphidicola BCc]